MLESNERRSLFRTAIARFIDERIDAKSKGANGNATELPASKDAWLADAARRVRGIQMVTHPLKATHPDVKINETTSLYRPSSELLLREEIGSHSLSKNVQDVSGDASALGVYKFLKVEVDGQQLLEWFQRDDPDLLAALHDNESIAREWAAAFKGLIRPLETLVSHEKAKQVYWHVSGEPTDDAGYHLLQPLFSSSLAHAVHADIRDARFGEANTQARRAKRDKEPHAGVYRDYQRLVARKLGGTKPQNISQLNSERGGVNYLLASLPPHWDQDKPKNYLLVDSALPRFNYYEGVHGLLAELCRLLKSNPDPTMETHIARERIEQAIGQALAAFGLASRQLFEPGWTRDDNCQLPLCEQLWLDPERAQLPFRPEHLEEDRAFAEALEWKDWPDEVAHRFGNWMNDLLYKRGLPVGDVEHAHWAKQAIIDAEWSATSAGEAS